MTGPNVRPIRTKPCPCGAEAELNRYCGAYICQRCESHLGLARCFCGWARDGGDGKRQLIELGETIEPEDY